MSKPKTKRKSQNTFMKDWQLWAMAAIPLLYFIMFHYVPMGGIIVAFKDYSLRKGIGGSPWAGLKYFNQFFSSPDFEILLKNTIILSLYNFLVNFVTPIFLAILLNEVRNKYFKKSVQMVTFFPHLISVVVLIGILQQFLSYNGGMVNSIVQMFGFDKINFFGDPSYFRHIFVFSGVWQNVGYGAVIYIATLSGLSPELAEASVIDGANRLQRIRHIDLPSITPTITIMLLLGIGRVMNLGHEKVFLLQNNLNYDVSEVISTYVYKYGVLNYEFSYATAVGLFNSVTNLVLILVANKISKKVANSGLW